MSASYLSSFLLFFWWIEWNLGLNTGYPCQGALLTISCSLGLQLHFLPNALLHNLANVFLFYSWAKGHIWTAFLKCKQSWKTWASETGRMYVVVNNVFYCKPSLTQCGGGPGSVISGSVCELLHLWMWPYMTSLGPHKDPGQGWCWTEVPQTPWAELILLCLLPRLEMDAENIRATFSN